MRAFTAAFTSFSPRRQGGSTRLRCRRGGGAGVVPLHAHGTEVVLRTATGHPSGAGFAELTGSKELPQV